MNGFYTSLLGAGPAGSAGYGSDGLDEGPVPPAVPVKLGDLNLLIYVFHGEKWSCHRQQHMDLIGMLYH